MITKSQKTSKKSRKSLTDRLTATLVLKTKPGKKAYKLADGKGLFLLIKPNGSKYWRYKYRFHGIEKLLAIGVYPTISLAEARDKRDEARKILSNGADPSFAIKLSKQTAKKALEDSFEVITYELYAKQTHIWGKEYGDKVIRLFERDIFPWLGKRPIAKIEAPELLDVL